MVAVNEPDRNNIVHISLPCKTVSQSKSKHVMHHVWAAFGLVVNEIEGFNVIKI